MKKLTLKSNAFSHGEVLTRAEMKKVKGGLYKCWCTGSPGSYLYANNSEDAQNLGSVMCGTEVTYECENQTV
ncbi:rSAM-modified peptide [Pedobacter riviphilus]|uniref:RSAM-modified peptide n=1 Tax=Pedobacter riviphilus TaxID=2766984 RepID=A0ABX6TH81_9SPHI|nr:TIGR04149 family rSAM-modified RiPP [Pedobacter riviphilus]QNR84862.1 rSAM-modified peptide [Pedobacter riviphilus]